MYSKPVLAVYALAFLTMYVITSIEWTLLPFLRHVSPTGNVSSAHYIALAALPQLVPIASNPILGWLASQCGTARVLGAAHIVVGVGILVMLGYSQRVTVGLCIYSIVTGLRVIRVAVLSELVAPAHRTAVLAWHFSMAPLGSLAAPLAWVVLQHVMGSDDDDNDDNDNDNDNDSDNDNDNDDNDDNDAVLMDRFTVNYGMGALIMLTCGVLILVFRHGLATPESALPAEAAASEQTTSKDVGEQQPSSSSSYGAVEKKKNEEEEDPEEEEPPQDLVGGANKEEQQLLLLEKDHNGATRTRILSRQEEEEEEEEDAASPKKQKRLPVWAVFVLFTALQLSVRLIYAATSGTFQPTLMHRFHFSEKDVANTYLALSVLSLFPPMAVAAMSRHLTDRQIMLFGLVLKLSGGFLYLPLFGSQVHPLGIVIGFVLTTKAGSFFVTAMLSLFSKSLPPGVSRAALFGSQWSIATGIPAILQVLYARQLDAMLGTWYFGLFFVPALLSLLVVAHGSFETWVGISL